LIALLLTWDDIIAVVSIPWIWSSRYESDPSNVNICSFSWDEEVWSIGFDTISSTVSLTTVVNGFVIVSSVVSAVVVISSCLFSSILVVEI